MSENDAPPPAPPGPGPELPPVDQLALLETAVAVLRDPAVFFKGRKGETGFQQCWIFAVACGLAFGVVAGAGSFLWHLLAVHPLSAIGGLVRWVLYGAIVGCVSPVVGGILLWVVCVILGSKASWEPSLRIAAYAAAVMPFVGLPFLLPGVLRYVLGWLVGLAACAYGVYVVVMGAKVLNFDESPPASAPPPA